MLAISSAEEFHAAVAKTEQPVVAFFSAPWCGGCNLVAPKVEALAEELQTRAQFVRVSAEQLETLCEEVEVDSFPHFRLYKEGKVLGDCTSSKFDKVEIFVRALVAPDTAMEKEETPEAENDETMEEPAAVAEETVDETAEESPDGVAEGETAESESAVEAGDGSKKRQEREEGDNHVAKKAKTEVLEEEVVVSTIEEDAVPTAEEVVVEKSEEVVMGTTEEDVATADAELAPTENAETATTTAELEMTEVEGGDKEEVADKDATNADATEEEAPAAEVEKETGAAPADKLDASEAEANRVVVDAPAA